MTGRACTPGPVCPANNDAQSAKPKKTEREADPILRNMVFLLFPSGGARQECLNAEAVEISGRKRGHLCFRLRLSFSNDQRLLPNRLSRVLCPFGKEIQLQNAWFEPLQQKKTQIATVL
jgi:hypothetical protein